MMSQDQAITAAAKEPALVRSFSEVGQAAALHKVAILQAVCSYDKLQTHIGRKSHRPPGHHSSASDLDLPATHQRH